RKPSNEATAVAASPAATAVPAVLPTPPRKLGIPGVALWNAVQTEFRIEDCGGIELLAQACAAAHRAESLTSPIDQDGETIHTAHGLKAHPCLKDELANRAFIVRTLEKLGLTQEAVLPIGRPSRGSGWRGSHADE